MEGMNAGKMIKKVVEEHIGLQYFDKVNADALIDIAEDVLRILSPAIAMSDGKYTNKDVFTAIANGDMQLWMVHSNVTGYCAAVVTKVIPYPSKKVLNIMFCAGKHLSAWIKFIECIKDFAVKNGCSSIEEYGRKGWLRELKPLGFEPLHYVSRIDLSNTGSNGVHPDEYEKNIYKKCI